MTAAWKSWPIPAGDVDMHEWQEGRCAWCGHGSSRSLHRDHNHETGLVRGYLCAGCNRAEVDGGNEWKEWREGDTPAQALGHFEVYRDQFGATPLAAGSALIYYTGDEQIRWWARVEATVRAGGRLPVSAPWTTDATTRRRDELARASQVLIDALGPAWAGA